MNRPLKQHENFASYLIDISLQYKVYLISLFVIALFAPGLYIAMDYKIKEVIDIIASDKNADIISLIGTMVLYKLGYHLMFFIERLLNLKYKPQLVVDLVDFIYHKTVNHSLHWFDSHLAGEISNKISDFQQSFIAIITYSFCSIRNIGVILVGIVFLLYINTLSAIITLAFVLLYALVFALLLTKQIRLQEDYVKARQKSMGIINDSVANIFSIKVIGSVLTEFRHTLLPSLLNWRDWDRKARKFDAYWVDNADTIITVIMFASQLYLAAYLYQNDSISVGDFLFIIMVTLKMHTEINEFLEKLLFSINPQIATMKASFNFLHSNNSKSETKSNLQNIKGQIEFKNVTFAYENSNQNVLNGLNLKIKSGQKLGIVGASGAGKTTIIKCLLRYFDLKAGEIILDKQEITKHSNESLWAHISIIPQDIVLMHRSIIENIRIAKQTATFDEVITACKQANIHDDIIAMPDQYDSIVGERGVKLSGGQRQRIAIARAILKHSPILIMDEATSALDTPTEKLIQNSINQILANNNSTTIVIAHRLSTLLSMDRIIVLQKGEIIESGTHQELIEVGGLYSALWQSQVGGFINELNQ
mgnify:CR=1 FL=1